MAAVQACQTSAVTDCKGFTTDLKYNDCLFTLVPSLLI